MNSSEYPVQVKLSTVGSGEVKGTLDSIAAAARILQGSINDANANGIRLSGTFRQTTTDGEKLSVTLRHLVDSKRQAAASAQQLSGAMSSVTTTMGTVAAAAVLLYQAMRQGFSTASEFISSGVELNALMETSRLGIAATITSYRQYKDEQGNVAKGAAAMNLAFAEAGKIQKLLQQEAFNTTATLEQMLKAYQALQVGAASQKANSEQLAAFTATLGNFATVSGRSFEELSAQTARVLQGVLTIRNPIVALLRGMGVDNQTIKSWVDQGIAVTEIQKKLVEYQKIGPEINKTWTGVMSNIKDVTQQTAAAMTGPIQDALKTMGQSFIASMTTTTTEGGRQITRMSEEVLATARVAGVALANIIEGIANGIRALFMDLKGEKSMKEIFLEAAEAAIRFKAQAEEIFLLMKQIAKTSMVPLQAGLGLMALKGGDIETAKEKVEWFQKLITDDIELTTGAVTRAKTREESIKKEIAAMRQLGEVKQLQSTDFLVSGHGGWEPKPTPMDPRIVSLAEQYKDFKALFAAKFDMAGLTGLDKALAENDVQLQQNYKSIDKMFDRLKGSEAQLAKLGITNLKGDKAEMQGAARQAALGADDKAFADADRKYADAYARISKLATNTANDEIEASRLARVQQLVDLTVIEMANAQNFYQRSVAAMHFADVMKQIDEKAARERSERFTNEMDVLRDELAAVTMDTYTRQQADIDKAFDTRKKNIEKEYGATSEQAKFEIEAAQKVRDARTAMLKQEENSIIGYRTKWEDEAKKIVLTTDSLSGGIALGMAKIKTSIISTTEAVGGFLASAWSALGSAFETGFYDILTGKLDDLGSVFKNLFDSILKDFSKMLSQMLMRWIMTGDAMGGGQGGGGGLSGVLSGLLGGNNAVYTPQGTGGGPGSASREAEYNAEMSGVSQQAHTTPSAAGAYAGEAGAILGIAGGLYTGISSIFAPHERSTATYQGQTLPTTGDFGGPGGGAALAGAGMAVAGAAAAAAAASAATAAGEVALAAAASATTVVGIVAAIVLILVAAAMYIFSGPAEQHLSVSVKEAFDKTGARTVVGKFVAQIIDHTASFVGQLAMLAAGPEKVSKFVTAYNDAFKKAYGTAMFDIAAGSKEDFQKDIDSFFNNVLPKMAMQAAFGQIGVKYGSPAGDRDWQGGVAGLDWNTKNGLMDQQGNFIHEQLYDPNAPIPQLLSGIGFSADAIGEIATKLSTTTDMGKFKQDLLDLVGIVVGLGDLAKQFGRTVAEWREFFTTEGAKKGTAAEFTTGLADLKGQGQLLEAMTGEERVSTAKQLLQDSGALLNQMATALQSIYTMIDSIQKSTAATIQSYRDKLLNPGEIEDNARASVAADMAAIATAANPAEVQAAWQKVMKDLSQVLDAIVARIQAIKALQQSYADFRTQMATNAGPQFATDPAAWLAKNQSDIDAVTLTLKTATGDDAIKGARELLRLTQERYNNELAMLNRVNAAIESIQATGDQTNQNLEMQAMGSVVDGKWVPDTHAQGQYLKKQYDKLMGDLAGAKTPEEVQAIYGKLQGIISQLAAQPQDPAHYAESRRILQGLNTDATDAATTLLKKWGKTLETDLAGTGDKLKAGETALAAGLKDAEKDFEKYLALMNDAAANSTNALNGMAEVIIAAMTDFSKYVTHWTWTMSHGAEEKDPNWDYEKNEPKGGRTVAHTPTPVITQDVWQDDPTDPTMEVCVAGPNKGKKRVKSTPGTRPPGTGPDQPHTAPVLNITVTANGNTAEEIADLAAYAVKNQVFAAMQASNNNLVRVLSNNGMLNPSVR